MPVPFQDIASGVAPVRIAYLRFVKEAESKGIRGCMFVISQQGRPPGVLFHQGGPALRRTVEPWLDGPPGGHGADQGIVPCRQISTRRGFSACPSRPHRRCSRRILTPRCQCAVSRPVPMESCVSQSSDLRKGKSVSFRWQKELDPGDSRAGPVSQYLESRDRLLEPFERAGLGLEEAFSHP